MSGHLQNAVAIIGMAGRFPGADNVEHFWSDLCAGREAIQPIAEHELEDGLTLAQRSEGRYVAARALLKDVDQFDAEFFRFLPREAELTDPQQRVLLECAWEAMEDAGYDPARIEGNVGVFAGSSINTYLLLHLAADPEFRKEFTRSYQVGSFPALVGNGQDFLATRISYKLNLRGPAMTVQSACSTSLLTVAQAWQSLVSYQSDLALAGGASISFPQHRGYFYQEGGMVSPDGHCRPFDKDASGTVFGAGAGMVLLKRAEEAIADGDHIYALILGAGVNNDGSAKVGYAAPSRDGQADAIAMAHAAAGVAASSISYVECHGTGTPLGDPIEVGALAQAFALDESASSRCVISSVKGNVGHLDVAAGVTGLIKATLALDHETIPGTLHYRDANEQLNLATTPFIVTSEQTPWPRIGDAEGQIPRRAGVSAFGVGGTNVHVVLEEAPVSTARPSARSRQVLVISARTSTALEAQCQRLMTKLAASSMALPDVAYTLAAGRRAFPHRLAFSAATTDEAIAQLNRPAEIFTCSSITTVIAEEKSTQVAMLFPGQGSQYPGMGEDLYRTEKLYRETVDDCCEQLRPLVGKDLREIMFPRQSDDPTIREAAVRTLEQTCFAQPAIFVTSYALARLWMSWGVEPSCLAGHSVGELVAACLAGVFTLSDALRFVARRGEWMQALPSGSMLAVRLPLDQLTIMLPSSLSIAAVNGPSLCVISGPTVDLETFATQLETSDTQLRRLHTSHAFHSAAVEPVIEPLRELLGGMTLSEPQMRIISTVTGRELTFAEAASPEYWARHCRVTVNFATAAAELVQGGYGALLEIGAGETLTTLVRQQMPRGVDTTVLSSLPSFDSPKTSWETMTNALAALWARGVEVNWDNYYVDDARHRVSLPTYPFERKRYWVDTLRQPNSADLINSVPALPDDAQQPLNLLRSSTMNSDPTCTASAGQGRTSRLSRELSALVEDLSGVELNAAEEQSSFLELGFDSLFLTQVAQKIQTAYGVKVIFRQLLDDLSSIWLVAEHLDRLLPADVAPAAAPSQAAIAIPAAQAAIAQSSHGLENVFISADIPAEPVSVAPGAMTALFNQQLQVMSQLIQQQLQMLGGSVGAAPVTAPTQPMLSAVEAVPNRGITRSVANRVTATEDEALHSRLVHSHQTEMTDEQKKFLDQLIHRYCSRTAKSKAFTQQHRAALADPRVVSGFRREWKEMVYSIVSSRSRGSKLWDIDGNEYIDLLNGFGPTMFGHTPDFVTDAVRAQLEEGFAIGPQTPLAGKAAELLTELTRTDRVTFCNTGSEAVMAAMRIARTVTGRDRVVFFAGDYHGQFDEVLVKQLRRKGEFTVQPAAPGIPRANLGNVTVLDYGTDESLQYIEQHASELAAVLIEPVQSRHPQLQPKEFLTRVREITRKSGTAFIFDEVVNGFRIHPRGAQGYYGIDADLVTYGKVVGGGMPIGILAGKAAFMDALDGGPWQFGDSSMPEVGVTFFAGTFVRHPLTMAALCATLEHIREGGEAMYTALNLRGDDFAARLNAIFEETGAPLHLENCGSVMYFSIPSDARFGGLLYYLLREKGVFILEGFPIYLTTEHSDADLDRVLQAFRSSVAELQSAGLLPGYAAQSQTGIRPVSNAPALPPEIPLTEPQLEIVLAAQTSDEASCAFNESFSVCFEGAMNVEALTSAWRSLLVRHDALRMSLAPAGDVLRVNREAAALMQHLDIAALDPSAQNMSLRDLVAAEGTLAFDLVEGPLIRAKLIRLAPQKHILVVTAHHLVCDGWSVNLIVNEMGVLYSAAIDSKAADLSQAMSFSRYAVASHDEAMREQQGSDLKYWQQQLSPAPDLLSLPADRNRLPERSFAGATYFTELPKDFAAGVRKAGASAGCTLFATLLGAWQMLLWRLSGNTDPVTLIPAAAQAQLEDSVLVGHCVHLLPIRTPIDSQSTAAEYLRSVKRVLLDAYEHQSATYGSIVRAVASPREPGRLPLSEIQFNLEQVGDSAFFEGLNIDVRANGKRATNFDLFLNLVDTGNGLRLECDYNTSLYDEATIASWLTCYRTLLGGIIADPSRNVATIPLLEPALRDYLVGRLNATAQPIPAPSVPVLIADAFISMPEKVAVDFYGMELTRAELAAQSDRLAAWLLRHGAGAGSLVGIYMDRSPEMLVAMLGAMKAGAAYVPLDPMFPQTRIKQILDETCVPVLLTLARHLEELPTTDAQILAIDTEMEALAREPIVRLPDISADAVAYVIFTSGSTGRPKGVEVTHGSVVNLLADASRRLGMTPEDRLLAVTTLSFDIAVLELLLPLVSGGTVLMAHRDDLADGSRLMELLEATQATALQATPVTWRMLLAAGFQSRPGFKMMCGGEAWTSAIANELLAGGGRIWNMYGPTETTIWSSITEVERRATQITIGPPMSNTRFYVLDARLELVPPGVPGELFIAGLGVARGYFARPELTAERFLRDPFTPTERMYRTGDEVRQSPDGRIQFLARLDNQIKLRGYRIELGEIETAMRAFSGIRDAVAILRNDTSGEANLVGYYTGGEDVKPAALRQELGTHVPDYMVPAFLVPLKALPLTPNGKLDRKALPDPQWSTNSREEEFVKPATETEKMLAEIVCQVLGLDRVSVRTSLLDLGADSLRMFQIAAHAHRRGLHITAKQLMRLRTVEAVAKVVEPLELRGNMSDTYSRPGAGVLKRISRDEFRVTA